MGVVSWRPMRKVPVSPMPLVNPSAMSCSASRPEIRVGEGHSSSVAAASRKSSGVAPVARIVPKTMAGTPWLRTVSATMFHSPKERPTQIMPRCDSATEPQRRPPRPPSGWAAAAAWAAASVGKQRRSQQLAPLGGALPRPLPPLLMGSVAVPISCMGLAAMSVRS